MTAWAPNIGVSDPATRWDPGFLAALLRSDRLTLVFCPAGAERDTMLRRVLMPLLGRRSIDRPIAEAAPQAGVPPITERRRQRSGSRRGAEIVIRFNGWGATPLRALREQLATALPPAPDHAPDRKLAALLQATAREHDARVLLVFDAFERHLAASPNDSAEVRQFDEQLVDWLRQPESPARVLFLVDDMSQALLQQRYGQSLQQFGRGWLRIRPQAATEAAATASKPMHATPAVHATTHDAAAGIATVAPGFDAVAVDALDIRAHDGDAMVTRRLSVDAAPATRPTRWFATFAGISLGVVLGLGLGWWFLARPDAAADRIGAVTIRPAPADPAGAPQRPSAEDPAPAAAVQAPVVQLPPVADSRPVVAAPPPLTLEVVVQPDSGAARTMIDELARRVAAPAGIVLTVVPPPGNAAAATLSRADALPAAREPPSSGGPRLLLPVFHEQVQVVAHTNGRWRFLHQLRGAHLNVGDAGGARAHTANALYRRLFGSALPSWDIDRRDEASALRELLREGSALDAVFVVSDRPALEQVPVAMRAQLRVLALDPQHPSTAEVMRGFPVSTDHTGRSLAPQVTSYLVMPQAGGQASAVQALACALGRAQPDLLQSGSAQLRGIDPRTSIPGGWVSLLSQGDAGCPPR